MEKIIFKISTKGERYGGVHKVDSTSVSLGRAYDNDIIIEDVFISPHQLQLIFHEDVINLEILDAVNPVFINHRLVESDSCLIRPGDSISIGRTQIEVLTEHSVISPTRQQFMSCWSQARKISPLIAIATLLLCCAAESFANFMQSSTDLAWREPAYMTLFSAAMLSLWAGVWALTGRLLKHQSLFFVHLFFTSVVTGVFIFISPIAEFIDFNASQVLPGEIANYVIGFSFFVILLKINLTLATNLQSSTRAAVLSSLVLFGLAFAGIRYYDEGFEHRQIYPTAIKPPFAVFSSLVSIEEYFSEVKLIDYDDDK